jgi:hypothetical protein
LIVIRRRAACGGGKVGSLGCAIGEMPVCCAKASDGSAILDSATIAISSLKRICLSRGRFPLSGIMI